MFFPAVRLDSIFMHLQKPCFHVYGGCEISSYGCIPPSPLWVIRIQKVVGMVIATLLTAYYDGMEGLRRRRAEMQPYKNNDQQTRGFQQYGSPQTKSLSWWT